MSAAGPTRTFRTVMPLMSMPRMAPATRSASSGDPASFTPPALPRPPTRTWALITTCEAPAPRKSAAAARASAGVCATVQAGTGRPWATSSDFASASWSFTCGRLREGAGTAGSDGTASAVAVSPPCACDPILERTVDTPSPYSMSVARWAAQTPRGVMQRDLVERARKGDHDAFSELAGAAISRLDATAWLVLRDPEQAKDAVQNTLVRAWRDLPTLRDPDLFDAWLHRMLVNACIDEARRLRRHRFDVELTTLHAPSIAGIESAIADRDQLERGFMRLEPDARALIVLHHYLDLPLPEVATTLGIPLGTAKSRLHRAIQVMRAALDADARYRPEAAEGR